MIWRAFIFSFYYLTRDLPGECSRFKLRLLNWEGIYKKKLDVKTLEVVIGSLKVAMVGRAI